MYTATVVEEGDIEAVLDSIVLPMLDMEHVSLLEATITTEEIRMVIRVLKPNTAPAPDGLTGEFYKTFEVNLFPHMQELFVECIT